MTDLQNSQEKVAKEKRDPISAPFRERCNVFSLLIRESMQGRGFVKIPKIKKRHNKPLCFIIKVPCSRHSLFVHVFHVCLCFPSLPMFSMLVHV